MSFNPPPNWPVPPGWVPDDPRRQRFPRWLVVALPVLLITGYVLVALLTANVWNKGRPASVTRATFAAHSLTGDPVTPDDLAKTREVLKNRTAHLGGQQIAASGDANTVDVSATGVTEAQLRGIAEVGRLHIRPVIHVIPARPDPTTPTRTSAPVTSAVLSDEKALRQTTNTQIQLLALQFQATRCGDPDALADNDDPSLPLVTCSQDGEQVYLLDKSIMTDDAIASASTGWNRQLGQYLVNLQFNDAATKAWAGFTRANVGSQVAFVVDTAVLSAPAIQEEIPTGRTQITGQFTADSARSLAAVVAERSLPVGLMVQSVGTVTLHPSFWTIPRIVVAVGGVAVLLVVIVGLLLVGRARRVSR